MVVQEQSRRDVKGDEHVDGVVFVTREYEKYAEHVHEPAEGVQQIYVTRGVCVK